MLTTLLSSPLAGQHPGVSTEKGKEREAGTPGTVLTAMLAEEEKQVNYLKSVLKSTNDRLQAETRRADQTEYRLEVAERQARDAQTKANKAESLRHDSEVEVAKLRAELKRFEFQYEMLSRELRRAEADILMLERQRTEAEEIATECRMTARKYQQALRDRVARDEAREEGKREGVFEGYEDGRLYGWNVGRSEGFQRGLAVARREKWEHDPDLEPPENYGNDKLGEGSRVSWSDG